MKLVLLCNGRETDGTGRLSLGLAAELEGLGDETHLIFHRFPRGIKSKLLAIAKDIPRAGSLMKEADGLIVHSALSLSLHYLVLAWARRVPVVAFVWDVYPESARQSGKITNPLVLLAYRAAERLGYRLATQVAVATQDYTPYLPSFIKNVRQVPMWVTDPVQECTRAEGPAVKLAFAGQLGNSRGLIPALERLLQVFPDQNIRLDLYSPDPLPKELDDFGSAQERLRVEYHGLISPGDLQTSLRRSDFGLVSLSSEFDLPAFPSKIMTYVAAGLPILYAGPPKAGIIKFLGDYNLGIHVDASGVSSSSVRTLSASYPEARARYLGSVRSEIRGLRCVFVQGR